ncbi:helix-turn-helix transcriptional regulator [Streptomyces antimycoticus]|uniref:Transcriptional regulator n=2 Tax=Streptomyces violaceusniger group TaxID=2839105 RepID=A0A4D4KQR4_9ACTN|nr:helix-turn-helix transcriptional regulator [Streptomyces antimycoticus]GDY48213.1 transcriptional regulator [Streptomyces antimycoticus]
MDRNELARCLRDWRDRLSPASIGLPASSLRRAPGLRREEVAHLAGLSVDYLARLEQGRAGNPSPSVLEALARALRLTDDENTHLFHLAGHADPRISGMNRHMTPGVHRIIDRLADTPVIVLDEAWQLVAANPPATALLGDMLGEPARQRNLLWRHFTGMPSRVVATPEEDAAFERAAVADLRAAAGRHPDDGPLQALITDLRKVSPRFDQRWQSAAVARHMATRKTILHPQVGPMTLDCDVLTAEGSDLRVVVYTAEPGSSDARTLALLNTIGTQTFTTPTSWAQPFTDDAAP